MKGDWLFNPEAVAWTIAAEGTISVGRTGKYYYPIVQVTNTSKDFIDKFLDMVDFGTVCKATKRHKNPNYKECHIWAVRNLADCLSLLKQILPFLPIKIEQAELVIELCESRLENFHRIGRDNLFDRRDIEIVDRIHELNKR